MKQEEQLLGNIVARDFRAASVLSSAGLDFCCGGSKTLDAACREKGIRTEEILEKLADLENQPVIPGRNFNEWQPDFLADYIVNVHHSYIRKTLPDLLFYTDKIMNVHGDRHPELKEVARLFSKLSKELLLHLDREEQVLFPAIREAMRTKSPEAIETIAGELPGMNDEHEFVGGTMDKINEITGGYKVPEDGCNTYAVTFRLLQEFEEDIHIHVHLENNILFPKSLNLQI
ncbi:MAG: iron-sulfur cluster repair di-iron protein [Bacteroidales bacterium]|jgi:regulator of cell morphogenesis and NO signaling|nr:iron-sulfur cluster repair di-iron protein [Bacteroidales bacterium]